MPSQVWRNSRIPQPKKPPKKHQKVVKVISSSLRHHIIENRGGNCGKFLCKANVVCVVPPKFMCFVDLIWGFLKAGHTCAQSGPLLSSEATSK